MRLQTRETGIFTAARMQGAMLFLVTQAFVEGIGVNVHPFGTFAADGKIEDDADLATRLADVSIFLVIEPNMPSETILKIRDVGRRLEYDFIVEAIAFAEKRVYNGSPDDVVERVISGIKVGVKSTSKPEAILTQLTLVKFGLVAEKEVHPFPMLSEEQFRLYNNVVSSDETTFVGESQRQVKYELSLITKQLDAVPELTCNQEKLKQLQKKVPSLSTGEIMTTSPLKIVEFAKALGRMIESKVRFENLTVEDAIIEALAEVPRKFSGITEAHCSPALTILQKVEWMYAQEFTSWYQQNFEMPELSSMNLTEVSEAVPA